MVAFREPNIIFSRASLEFKTTTLFNLTWFLLSNKGAFTAFITMNSHYLILNVQIVPFSFIFVFQESIKNA